VDGVGAVALVSRQRLLPPALAAHAMHTLSEAAFLKEALCLARELPVEQRARDCDEHKRCIRGDFGVSRPSAVMSETCTRVTNPVRYFFGACAPRVDELLPERLAVRPLFESALAEIIPIVAPKLFQAETRRVGKLHFDPLRGAAGSASLHNILCAAASGLDHLVVGPATSIDVAFAETNRDIEAELRHPEAF